MLWKSLMLVALLMPCACSGFLFVKKPSRKQSALTSTSSVPTPTPSPSPAELVSNPLAFTGASLSSNSVENRFFRDSSGSGSKWTLTGTCDAKKGKVTVSGSGIQAAFDMTCQNNGTFSNDIYHSSSSNTPKFWSYDATTALHGARVVKITQGSDTSSTTIFLASTSHVINYITTPAGFNAMPFSASDYNILSNNLDMTAFPYAEIANFSGVFEGNGYTVSNINFSGRGIFHIVSAGATISNLIVLNGTRTLNAASAGGLIGQNGGALVGSSFQGTIVSCAGMNSGGLVGLTQGGSVIFRSGADVVMNCSGRADCGGLTGTNWSYIEQSYSKGTLTNGAASLGGLVSSHSGGHIRDSYSQANITGTAMLTGGLAGGAAAPIYTSYSTGNVVCPACGFTDYFVGATGSTITDSYYRSDATCTSAMCNGTGGGTPATTANMRLKATFATFDFTTAIWKIDEGVSYPKLNWE